MTTKTFDVELRPIDAIQPYEAKRLIRAGISVELYPVQRSPLVRGDASNLSECAVKA